MRSRDRVPTSVSPSVHAAKERRCDSLPGSLCTGRKLPVSGADCEMYQQNHGDQGLIPVQ
jgi:hypothetical protein